MIIDKNFINTSLNRLKANKEINNIKDGLNQSLILKQNLEETHIKTSNINETLKDILKSYGFMVNDETINMLINLLDNNIPLNDNILKQLDKALKLFNLNDDKISDKIYNKIDVEKAIFMLNNKISVTKSNAQILEGFINGESHLMHRLTSLGESIEKIENSEIKHELINTLLKNVFLNTSGNNQINKINDNYFNLIKNTIIANIQKNNIITKEDIVKIEKQLQLNNITTTNLNEILESNLDLNKTEIIEIMKILHYNNEFLKENTTLNIDYNDSLNYELSHFKNNLIKNLTNIFSLNPNSDTPKDIDIILNKLKENLIKAENILLNTNNSDTLKNITQTKETLDFLNLIKDSIYIPLPLNIGQQNIESEIFVFKDSKLKENSKKNATSALVALNTVNLGRIETYIQKNNNNLNLQFRLENMETETVLKANINKLYSLLNNFDYSIKSYSIIPIETPFNILSKEPIAYKQKEMSLKPETNPTIDIKT